MNQTEAKILIVDDENSIRSVLSASLKDEGYQVVTAENGSKGLEEMERFKPSIVLLDIWMPGNIDGMEVLKRAKSQYPHIEFVMMSGHGTIETAVKATKLGAWDFIEKPLSMDKISITISNIYHFQQERQEKNALLNKLRKNIAIIGESPQVVNLKQMISRIAPTQSWALITGENGTGKELVAQNIHYLSVRASRPFIDVNCAGIPEELMESELFGYEKGAFAGADKMKKGKFDAADGGTLYINEIAEMDVRTQLKLLRVLQEKSFQRMGGNDVIRVDVRVIAATTRDLEAQIKEGKFREDLYYRLNVIPFHVPPLKERASDITALVAHFSDQFAKEGGFNRKIFSDQAFDKLKAYPWPGNVRELRNFIERIYILTPGDFVDVPDLKVAGLSSIGDSMGYDDITSFREARAKFEKEFLLKKIAENGGNISRTAETIGLERSYLHRKIKFYGIEG